jgi:hypothetical protein
LSARRGSATIPAMMPSGLPDLAAVLGFSPEELMLNRAGRVSDRQQALLRRARRYGLVWLLIVGVAMAAFIAVILLFVLPKLNKNDAGEGSVKTTPIIVGVVAFVVLIVIVSIVRTRSSLTKLGSGVVHTASGPASTRVRRMRGNDDSDHGTGLRYELTIGRTTFFVSGQSVLGAFVEGAPYRAYYAAGRNRVLNRILSAEPL